MPELGDQETERFAVVALDIRHQVLSRRIISIGSKSETIVDPREVFAWPLRVGASRIIVAHNHPSGGLSPSPEDINLTRQLISAGKLLQMPVLDHLIIAKGDYQSLRQTTSLWNE
jgi:DNA repair protein RadC